jgi:hypothetical protein
METMLFGSEVKPHILTNAALAKQRKVCGVCKLKPRIPGANWCEDCREHYNRNIAKKPKTKRGNPNWCRRKAESLEERPTEFEDLVLELGLSESEYDHSPKLVKWIRANRNRRYVPEWLLLELGIEVDVKFAF